MRGPTLTIQADPRAVSMAAALRELFDVAPHVAITGRAFRIYYTAARVPPAARRAFSRSGKQSEWRARFLHPGKDQERRTLP